MINQQTKTGGVITWGSADWKAGLGAQGTFSSSHIHKQTEAGGWAYLSNIDPFYEYGILSPAIAPSTTFTNSSSLAGVIVSSQFVDSTFFYGIDAGGKLHYVNFVSSPVITVGAALGVTWPHTITGTTPIGQDTMLYRHNLNGVSVVSLFYSYYNTVNWNIGGFINQSVIEDTYMSGGGAGDAPATPLDITTASPAGDGRDVGQLTAPHPMAIGADGILYIGSGRYLHAYDGNTGSNGTFSSRVLTLPQGFQIISIRKYQDQLLLAGNYYSNQGMGADGTGEALLYTWNYTDSDITQVTPLEDSFVTALFLWKGMPTVITNGKTERNGQNKIKMISGNSLIKYADFDGVLPLNRGILVANDVLYLNSGGKIITIGDKFVSSRALNNICTTSQSNISGIVVFNYSLNCLLASGGNGSNYSINNFNGNFDSGFAYPYSYQPSFPSGFMGKIKYVQIEYKSPVAGSGVLSLQVLTDDNLVSTQILLNLDTVTRPLVKRYYVDINGLSLPNFNTIGLYFLWGSGTDAPTISSVSVEYDYEILESNT